METQSIERGGLTAVIESLEKAHASKDKIEMGMDHYLESKARQKGVPIRGTFELTPLCNFDCKMCYVHLSRDQLHSCENTILNGDEWIAIISQAIDAGIITALLTGGEAMLHPDFDRIFLYLQSKGVHTCVNTNGVLLTEKRLEFFEKNKPKEIRVTLYGANDDTYEKVTGHRAFSQVVENLQRAKAAGLCLGINITPNCYMNINDCLDLVDLAEALGIPYLINTALSEPRKETGRNETLHDFSLDQYIELYKRINKKKNNELFPMCETNLPDTGRNDIETKGIRCAAGRSSFAVLWSGKLQACLSFTDKQLDLRTMSFMEAWRQINQYACSYPTPRECQECAYKQLCTICVVRHAEGAPVGHANPAVCDRARRMVSEGLSVLV